VCEPPAIEKLKVLQAMSSAIVDQSAAILIGHFSKFIHALHVVAFPSGLPPVQSVRKNARRVALRRPVIGAGADVSVADLNFCPQSSSLAPSLSASESLSSVIAASPSVARGRSSARLQSRGTQRYTEAGGWWLRQ
jgi:hypothetical protein